MLLATSPFTLFHRAVDVTMITSDLMVEVKDYIVERRLHLKEDLDLQDGRS